MMKVMMKMNNLEVKNISFNYDGVNDVIKNISFAIDENDFLVILGASGDGKTTLLKIISGLLKQDSGSVYFNNQCIDNLMGRDRHISYIFQENFLYTHMTIYQNLLMGFKKQKITDEEKDLKIKEILKIFKITKFINLKPTHLSLGERQKISIAKAILSNDQIYLFDEPFSALDQQSRDSYLPLLKQAHEVKKCPFIYVTHDQKDAYKIASKIMIIKKGKILQFGSLYEVNNNPEYLEVREYFGEKLNIFEIDIDELEMTLLLNNKKILLKNKNITNYLGKALIGIETKLFTIIDEETEKSFKATFIDTFIDNDGIEYAHLMVNNKEITVRKNQNQIFERNEEVNVIFEEDYYLFDRFTHKNIATQKGC